MLTSYLLSFPLVTKRLNFIKRLFGNMEKITLVSPLDLLAHRVALTGPVAGATLPSVTGCSFLMCCCILPATLTFRAGLQLFKTKIVW